MHNASATRVVKLATAFVILLMLRGLAFAQSDTEDGSQDSPQQRRGFGQPERGVYKARITPHWLTNNVQFWYRNDLRGGTKEFILVDAEKGIRQRAFDHDKLAAALAKAAGEEVKSDRLPFSEIQFTENGNTITFDAFSKSWRCDLDSYQCVSAATNSNSSLSPSPDLEGSQSELAFDGPRSPQEQTNQLSARPRGNRRRGERDVRSPDEKWT